MSKWGFASMLTFLLLLGTCLSAVAESTLEAIVADPAFDITPLTAQLNALQGNLLSKTKSFDPKEHTLTAMTTQKSKYVRLYSDFVAGMTYVFTMGGNQVMEGSPDLVRIRVHDFENKKVVISTAFIPDRDFPQAWIFTIPEDTDMTNLSLLLYSGSAGKTWGNSIRFTNLGLYMWMPGIAETGIIQSLGVVEIPETPTEETLLRYLNNPYTDITPLLDTYASRYDDLLADAGTYDPSLFTLQAGANARFQYQRLYDGLRPGETYFFSIGTSERLAGEATVLTLRVYDFTNSRSLLDLSMYASWNKPQAKIFTVPEEVVDTDATISLLLYAGLAGETADNSFVFSDVWLYPWDGVAGDDVLIAGLARLDNTPVETNTDTAPTAGTARENLLMDTPDSVTNVQAGAEDDYASVCLYDGFVAGNTYTLSFGKLEMVEGGAANATVRLLSTATGETLQRRTAAIADGMFEWTFTVPRDADTKNLELHVYAGVVGKTRGNLLRLYDAALYLKTSQ